VIIEPENSLAKFRIKEQLSYETLNKFIIDWIDGKAERYYKSQPIPEQIYDSDKIRVLVGYNFKDVVFDKNYDVVVQFYSDYCNACLLFNEQFVELAKGRMSGRKGLVFGKVNMDQNDLEDFEIEGMPRMVAFPKGNKEGIVFGSDWNLIVMEAFLEDVLGDGGVYEESNEPPTDQHKTHIPDL
jgi:thiol-disulfide isomerase/thioredoxin